MKFVQIASICCFFFLSLLVLETEGRIREEELVTVTTNSAIITWVTRLPSESQVVYGPCSSWMRSALESQASSWESALHSQINSQSPSRILDRFKAKMSQLQQQYQLIDDQHPHASGKDIDFQKEADSFILENHAWFNKLFARANKNGLEDFFDEPEMTGNRELGRELVEKNGGEIVKGKRETAPTLYHFVEIDGLTPGVEYCYQALEGDQPSSPTPWSPGYFTTLTPPAGEKLFTFATMNDMHVGEQVAGLVVIGGIVLTPGFEWDDPDNPYWKFTNEAAVQGINSLGVDFTIAKGDVSSDFKEHEYKDCKGILDGLQNPYYVMRGNHDRVESGPDFYKQIFNLTTTWYSFDHKGFHFLALDSVNIANGSPELSDEQFDFLEKDLQMNNGTKTFVFLHHAVTWEAFVYSLIVEDRVRFLEILTQHPQVVGVFSGHSHRAALTNDRDLPEMIFAETPSAKEYPMGYSVYEVYTGGYIQHFHRSYCVECLEWNSMTRQQYFRLAPFLQYGTLQEKNFVVNY